MAGAHAPVGKRDSSKSMGRREMGNVLRANPTSASESACQLAPSHMCLGSHGRPHAEGVFRVAEAFFESQYLARAEAGLQDDLRR